MSDTRNIDPVDVLAALVAEAEASGLTKAQIAAQMGIAGPMLDHWLKRRSRPGATYRAAIEKWSRRRLSADLWLDEGDRRLLASVVPFRPKAVKRARKEA